MNIKSIRLDLEFDRDSGVFTVTSPDVPGLVTEGSTPEEIQRNVQEAIEVLLMGWAELGKEPPPLSSVKSVLLDSPYSFWTGIS